MQAPEVLLCQDYTYKVDCFSWGIIAWELFHKTLLLASVMNSIECDDSEAWAYRVSGRLIA